MLSIALKSQRDRGKQRRQSFNLGSTEAVTSARPGLRYPSIAAPYVGTAKRSISAADNQLTCSTINDCISGAEEVWNEELAQR
eukprot:scaffold30274_cov67-Cyclotella_meneghiniana.AAC.2